MVRDTSELAEFNMRSLVKPHNAWSNYQTFTQVLGLWSSVTGELTSN